MTGQLFNFARPLTAQQARAVALSASGLSGKQVAGEMGVSLKYVRHLIAHAKQRAQVKSLVQLGAWWQAYLFHNAQKERAA